MICFKYLIELLTTCSCMTGILFVSYLCWPVILKTAVSNIMTEQIFASHRIPPWWLLLSQQWPPLVWWYLIHPCRLAEGLQWPTPRVVTLWVLTLRVLTLRVLSPRVLLLDRPCSQKKQHRLTTRLPWLCKLSSQFITLVWYFLFSRLNLL